MKWLNSKHRAGLFVAIAGIFGMSCPITGQEKTDTVSLIPSYQKRIQQYQTRWDRLVPQYGKIQFAGNMGLLSFGFGWDYGKNSQWETDLLFGFVPRYSSDKTKMTFTLKENFTPWAFPIGKTPLLIEPLSCGLYLNTIFSDQFWRKQPDRYPDGYYEFSTRMRIHIFVGQRIRLDIPEEKRFFSEDISLFYEISTCDMLLISRATNRYLKPKDYLSLSFGLKIQFL